MGGDVGLKRNGFLDCLRTHAGGRVPFRGDMRNKTRIKNPNQK